MEVGGIILLKYEQYKDTGLIDLDKPVRPFLLISENEDDIFLLKITASKSNLRYPEIKLSIKNNKVLKKDSYVDLVQIYQKRLLRYKTLGHQLDDFEMLNLLEQFLVVQSDQQDDLFPLIEEDVQNRIQQLENNKEDLVQKLALKFKGL
jgi:hypothetical protein